MTNKTTDLTNRLLDIANTAAAWGDTTAADVMNEAAAALIVMNTELNRLTARIEALEAALPKHRYQIGEEVVTSVRFVDTLATVVKANHWRDGVCQYDIVTPDGERTTVEDCDIWTPRS